MKISGQGRTARPPAHEALGLALHQSGSSAAGPGRGVGVAETSALRGWSTKVVPK